VLTSIKALRWVEEVGSSRKGLSFFICPIKAFGPKSKATSRRKIRKEGLQPQT